MPRVSRVSVVLPILSQNKTNWCTQRKHNYTYWKKSYRICKVAVYVYIICSSNGGLLLSRTRFEGLCHCGVVSTSRLGDERGSTRGNTQKRQRYTKGVRRALAGRGRWGGAPGPRRPRFTTTTGQYEVSESTLHVNIYFTVCEARRGDEPISTEQKHTHGR